MTQCSIVDFTHFYWLKTKHASLCTQPILTVFKDTFLKNILVLLCGIQVCYIKHSMLYVISLCIICIIFDALVHSIHVMFCRNSVIVVWYSEHNQHCLWKTSTLLKICTSWELFYSFLQLSLFLFFFLCLEVIDVWRVALFGLWMKLEFWQLQYVL